MSDTKLINLDELAEKTGIDAKTLKKLTWKGEIPAYRPTRDIVLFDLDEVTASFKNKPFKKWSKGGKGRPKKA